MSDREELEKIVKEWSESPATWREGISAIEGHLADRADLVTRLLAAGFHRTSEQIKADGGELRMDGDWAREHDLGAPKLGTVVYPKPSAVPVVPSESKLFDYMQGWTVANTWGDQQEIGDDDRKEMAQAIRGFLTRSGWLDLSTVRRFSFSDDIPGVIYPDPKGAACWFADLQPKEGV